MKKTFDIAQDFANYKLSIGLTKKVYCSNKESVEFAELLESGEPLPEGIHYEQREDVSSEYYDFYRLSCSDLSEGEAAQYLLCKQISLATEQLSMLKTIRGCVVFMTVVAALGVLAGIILAFL